MLVFLMLGLVFGLNSCQEDILTKGEDIDTAILKSSFETGTEEFKYNKNIQKMAKALAKSLNSKDLRKAIKEEAMLKVDGDYDIIWKNFKYKKVITNKGETEIVEFILDNIDQKNSNKEKQELINFGDANKMLQIAVPIHCEDWDIDNYTPLVTFLPFRYDEHKVTKVTAFDSDGKSHQLSVDIEPTNPVIVIGRSERLDIHGEVLKSTAEITSLKTVSNYQQEGSLKSAPAGPTSLEISHGTANSVILQWADVTNETSYEIWRMHEPGEYEFWPFATTTQNDNNYINNWIQEGAKVSYKVRALNNDGYSSWSPIRSTTVSARNDNEYLKIKRMKFSNAALTSVEKWLSGAPEIRLRIVKGSSSGATTIYTSGVLEPAHRNDINENWWNQEVSLFPWDTDTYGTVLSFEWREEDWDDNVTYTINGSWEDTYNWGTLKAGGSVTISGDKGGDQIGNTLVLWWHNKDQIYNLTGFEWQFVF